MNDGKEWESPTLSHYNKLIERCLVLVKKSKRHLLQRIENGGNCMSKKKIENQVEELVLPILEERAFDLVDVEFVKEGRNWYLRVYIDKPGGINIDDCEEVSIRLSEELDREDPIKHSYILEVSSPGLDRPLKRDKDFERYKGELVEVKLFKAIDGKKVFEGELLGLIDNRITIKQSNDQILSFNKEEVATTKRIIKF